ncbi:uncharacterized protein LOC115757426 [Rhodamnia argentea]|uniref:Uncharacterized protein LOC115757426 n=1 Tax=Rhodamnia argentea TaxID=178133 RepID=A0A8B8R286_9MYRT|nr:uncharacterized protein LOC115757426 [Rhodamnia argentea]
MPRLFLLIHIISCNQSMQCDQTSNPHDDRPVLMENWPRFELQTFTPPVEKKGMGENESNGSLVAPEKPMPPPGVKCYSEDEEPRFEKVKQDTAAESMKTECISLDETAARAKYGQSYTVENLRTPTIESLPRGFRFEETEGALQSEFESLHVSSAEPLELSNDPETQRIHSDEEQTFEKVKKQECPLGNVKPEWVSWDESAATAKVLEYKESISAGSSPKRTDSEEIDHTREKSNLVTALARPTTKNTKSSINPPLLNPVNVVVGISLSIAITAIFATIWRRA